MEAPKSLVHDIGGPKHDTLRFGLDAAKSQIIGSHPLESAYPSAKMSREEMNRKVLAHTYGAAFPLKMELDRQILSRLDGILNTLSRFQRPPGPIPSSMLGLEAVTGALEDFGFEDYLNDPRDSENFRPLDMHNGMEVRLKLSSGPVCPSFM